MSLQPTACVKISEGAKTKLTKPDSRLSYNDKLRVLLEKRLKCLNRDGRDFRDFHGINGKHGYRLGSGPRETLSTLSLHRALRVDG